MEEKKKMRFTLIATGAAALLWTIRAILGIFLAEYETRPLLFILNLVCMAVWIVCWIVWFNRYRSLGKED